MWKGIDLLLLFEDGMKWHKPRNAGCFSSSCYNKVPCILWLTSNRNLFLTVLEAVFWWILCSGLQTAELWLYMVKGVKELSGVPFLRVLLPFMRSLASWPNHLSKAHLQMPTVGIRRQCMNSRGHKIQSVAQMTSKNCIRQGNSLP
jgi:hypothetical protein